MAIAMSAIHAAVARRSIELGPDDPAEVFDLMYSILRKGTWKSTLALVLTGSASGAMMLFLFSVFLWRRELVNRVSLRLIFVISLFDFLQCMVQTVPPAPDDSARCRAGSYFIDFFMSASVYLSSSIAFNLQMAFLRKSRKPLPDYVEYLYYIVPILVVFLQFTPQYIWAAKHHTCTAFVPIQPATTAYIIYIVFAGFGIHTVFVLYNVITSVRVIISLYIKQRQVGQALKSAMQGTTDILGGSHCTDNTVGGAGPPRGPRMSFKDQQQLQTMRRVYKACMRIALYPLAPLVWYIMFVVFLTRQYYYTFTWKSDAYAMARLLTLSWYSSCVLVMANFLVFLTDPAVLAVISEVHKALSKRFGAKKRGDDDDSSSDDLPRFRRTSEKKTGVTIKESTKTKTLTDDISISSSDLEAQDTGIAGLTDATSTLEYGQSYASSLSGLRDDAVGRRVRGDADAQRFLDDM
ncbi:hypothetical protein LPJ61_002329 [Coemansia biformis]|uniref:Uncharacterized protein n=1 Tax=Coemansia biformis TaxID=1286918 RepID=A0A9W8CZR9_9FUNG|nr:hypothetical protein LPJ61_002329 [Coemansia biformis]